MKQLMLALLLTFSGIMYAQDKVNWTVSYNDTEKQLEFRASIAEGWHLYSQFIQNDIGPVPTSFVFNESTAIKWEGKVNEPTPIHAYDENFEASLDFFKDEVVFTRKLKSGSKGVVTGYITFMVCNEIMCLPPVDIDFSVTIP